MKKRNLGNDLIKALRQVLRYVKGEKVEGIRVTKLRLTKKEK